jgi:catechol 2,3-dioxygenase-like lactoylglutathione lyase family enzyme
MITKGLRHIALKTRDLKKTEAFYTQVLGLKIAFRHPPDMLFLATPGSGDLVNFIQTAKRASGNQALDHIGFRVSSAALKRLERKLTDYNVTIEGRRGKNALYFSDPNGYRIEYYCD